VGKKIEGGRDIRKKENYQQRSLPSKKTKMKEKRKHMATCIVAELL